MNIDETPWKYTICNSTSGESTCYLDDVFPITAVLEKVYSLKDASKKIPESPHPTAQASSEQSMGWCGTVDLLSCYIFYSQSLTEESERRVNNPIALEVKEYGAILRMLIKPKYRDKVVDFGVLGRFGIFHTLKPRRTELPQSTCSPSEMLHLFFCVQKLFGSFGGFFHITCSLNKSTGDKMCWQAQPFEHLTKSTMEKSSQA